MTPSKKEGISTKLAATFSYRDVLLLCGDGSRTTSPSSDDHHSASKLTHLIKGNPIIRKNTKNSIQALPMNKISTKASASDSKNPKVFQKTTSFVAATPDAASIITKVTSVHQVKDKETRATDMMKKHTTISSSLDIVSKEEIIVPSNSVDKKKNDHLSSSTKEGTLALVSESSATSVVYVPDKVKTDVLMKMKKHTTISSSSLDNASDEIAPSTFVAKKNDHLSSSKEGTARVHDSSVTSKFHVEVKETEATDMMKMKKHNTISSSSLHIVSDEVISSTSIDKKNDHVPSAKKEGTARVYDSSAASKFHVEVKETEATHMMKMSKKHATISSSLDVVSKEMIVPSTFVDKKNDHLSFTKGGNALLVYDSSATFDPVVSTSPSVSTTSNKVDTAKILKIKKKQVETKKVKTSSTSSLFSDESKEKVLNKQVKIAAAPLLADESKVEIFHETEAPTKVLDDSGSNDSFLSSFHRKSSASISNKIFSRGKTYSFGFVKASKLFLASFLLIALFIPSCEASLVHKGSKLMGNLKAGDSSTLNEKSVEDDNEGKGLDRSSAIDPDPVLDVGKKFINYEFFTPALCFDVDDPNNEAKVLKKFDSLSFLDCKDSCSGHDLCSSFQWDGNECLLLRDISTKDIVALSEDAEVQTACAVKTTTTKYSTEGDGDHTRNKVLLQADVSGTLCSDSISLDEKKVILRNMERILRAEIGSSFSLMPAPEHADMKCHDDVEVEGGRKMKMLIQIRQNRHHDLEELAWLASLHSALAATKNNDRFGASITVSNLEIVDDKMRELQEVRSNQISLNNDSFLLKNGIKFDDSGREFCAKSSSLEPGSTIVMRPCGDINSNNLEWFFFDPMDRLRLSMKPEFCLQWKPPSKQPFFDTCGTGTSAYFKFEFDQGKLQALGFGSLDATWLLGIRPEEKKYLALRLFNAANNLDNESLTKWEMIHMSESPSTTPSALPTNAPTHAPTQAPTQPRTRPPTRPPTPSPTSTPTMLPTNAPTTEPTNAPTTEPTNVPTTEKTNAPSISHIPSLSMLPTLTNMSFAQLHVHFSKINLADMEISEIFNLSQNLEDIIKEAITKAFTPLDVNEISVTEISSLQAVNTRRHETSLDLLVTFNVPLPGGDATSDDRVERVNRFIELALEREGMVIESSVNIVPSESPSIVPSMLPSTSTLPSILSSAEPSSSPSLSPSSVPSLLPSNEPSSMPSSEPSVCRDEPGWRVGGPTSNTYSLWTCMDVENSASPEDLCVTIDALHDQTFEQKRISDACCVCQGGDHQSAMPSQSSQPTSFHPSVLPSTKPSTCQDESEWFFDTSPDGTKLGCGAVANDPEKLCAKIGALEHMQKTAYEACCICGGGDHQSVRPSMSPTKFSCTDVSDTWRVGGDSKYANFTCADIENTEHPSKYCEAIENLSDGLFEGRSVSQACCVCGGGTFIELNTATPSSTETFKPSISSMPSMEEYPSISPSSKPSTCVDDPNWYFDESTEMTCKHLSGPSAAELCERFDTNSNGKSSYQACCACNGGIHISNAPSLSPALFFGEECSLNEECKSGVCGDGNEISSSIFHGKLVFRDNTEVYGDTVLTFFPNGHLQDLSLEGGCLSSPLNFVPCVELSEDPLQEWIKIPIDDSTFALKNADSNKCLTSSNALSDCNLSNPAQSLRVETIPYPVQRCTPDNESSCEDISAWKVGGTSIYANMTCTEISSLPLHSDFCLAILSLSDGSFEGRTVGQACCACGGGSYIETNTVSPSLSATDAPSVSAQPSMEAYPSSYPTSVPSECKDDPNWFFDYEQELGCNHIDSFALCDRFGGVTFRKKTAFEACCICNGGEHVSVSPSAHPTVSSSPSMKPTSSSKPSEFPTESPTAVPSPTPADEKADTIFDGHVCSEHIECMGQALCGEKDFEFHGYATVASPSLILLNAARNKPVTTNAISNSKGPELLVDGDVDTDQAILSIDSTNDIWWDVDLVEHYEINKIIIHQDPTNANDFDVVIYGDDGIETTYAYVKPLKDIQNIIEMTIDPPIHSRKVRITREAQMMNNLREVEVFGYEITDNPSFCLLDNLDGTSSVKECDRELTKTPGLLTLYPSGEVTSSPYGNCLSPPHPGSKTVTFEKCSRDDVNSARWTIERTDVIDESNTNAFRLQHQESGQCLATKMKYEFLKGTYEKTKAEKLCQDWPKLRDGGYESTVISICATKTWRLFLQSTYDIWDILKIKMFQGPEEMFPISVKSSKYQGRHRPENVLTTDGIWGGRWETDTNDYWVEFTFSEPVCISEAIWQNHVNWFANGEVKLQGKKGDQWVDYGTKAVTTDANSEQKQIAYQVNMVSQQESKNWRLLVEQDSIWDVSEIKMFTGDESIDEENPSSVVSSGHLGSDNTFEKARDDDVDSYWRGTTGDDGVSITFSFEKAKYIARAVWTNHADNFAVGPVKLQYEKIIPHEGGSRPLWITVAERSPSGGDESEPLPGANEENSLGYEFSNSWRITAINQNSPWDLLRLRFFSGSTELSPDSVFESGNCCRGYGQWDAYFNRYNVLEGETNGERWGGLPLGGTTNAYIGFSFNSPVFVTKVIWENYSAHQANDVVKLQAEFLRVNDLVWEDISEKEAVKVPSSWDSLSHPLPLLQVATTIAGSPSFATVFV